MDLETVEIYTNEKLNEYGLSESNWTFKWDRSVSRFGQCRYRLREIGISKALAELNTEAEVFDTILHEIAHALAEHRGHHRVGHSQVWKDICVEIGARPVRCYSPDAVIQPKGKFSGVCSKCSKTFQKERQPRSKAYHNACNSRGRYNYPIKWTENKTNLVVVIV